LREREKERELELKGRVETNDATRNGKEEQKRNEPGKGEEKEPAREGMGRALALAKRLSGATEMAPYRARNSFIIRTLALALVE
jgi:hypothetical protein